MIYQMRPRVDRQSDLPAQTPLQMSEVESACDCLLSAFDRVRAIEIGSQRTEVYTVDGAPIKFTWHLCCYEEDRGVAPEPIIVVPLSVLHKLAVRQLAQRIEDYLKALTPSQKWPDTLAEMGMTAEPTE